MSVALLVALLFVVGCSSTLERTRLDMERSASRYSHFATRDIISNRPTDRGWPTNLVAEQAELMSQLRVWSNERESLHALLQHPLPKVRTLALGALFVREDPRELPFIASLMNDSAPAIPLIEESASSEGGIHPLSQLEHPQTVGNVARAMIGTYLELSTENVRNRSTAETSGLFASYWEKHGTRKHCASWLLMKVNRASHQTEPVQPEHQNDIRHVLSEVNLFPVEERPWVLLFVRCRSFPDLEAFISEASLVAKLKSVGSEQVMRFLQREPVIRDPDLWFDDSSAANNSLFSHMSVFILRHARELLRPQDAEALIASEERERAATSITLVGASPWWAAAAAEIANQRSTTKANSIIEQSLRRYPLTGILGGREQSVLMAALWRMRGSSEKARLVDWFYEAMMKVLREKSDESNHGPVDFLRQIKANKRADTKELLAALIADARFEQTDWPVLKELLEMASEGLPKPLVSSEAIYAAWPPHGDNRMVLDQWREILRRQ